MTEEDTLCDGCSEHFSFLVLAWGRELNEAERKCNDALVEEGKAEKCLYFDRYFNKNFTKKKHHCAILDEFEEPQIDDSEKKAKT